MTEHASTKRGDDYKKGSLTLTGSIAMGTGIMIGAGIFAVTGQVTELAGGLFPVAFITAALVVAFSAYSYIKVCNEYLRTELNAKAWVLLTALVLDAVVLGAFLYLKLTSDSLVVGVGLGSMALIFGPEAIFIARKNSKKEESNDD